MRLFWFISARFPLSHSHDGDYWMNGPLPRRIWGAHSESKVSKEFAQHERIATALKLGYYFAHPHAAWERVAKEYLNG